MPKEAIAEDCPMPKEAIAEEFGKVMVTSVRKKEDGVWIQTDEGRPPASYILPDDLEKASRSYMIYRMSTARQVWLWSWIFCFREKDTQER